MVENQVPKPVIDKVVWEGFKSVISIDLVDKFDRLAQKDSLTEKTRVVTMERFNELVVDFGNFFTPTPEAINLLEIASAFTK